MSRQLRKTHRQHKVTTPKNIHLRVFFRILIEPSGETRLSMFIKYMDRRFRGSHMVTSQGIYIFSASTPEVRSPKELYLWGSDPERYWRPVGLSFINKAAAEEALKGFILALTEWTKKHPCWGYPKYEDSDLDTLFEDRDPPIGGKDWKEMIF